jgi:4-alpha-glucanotransferase
MQNVVHSSSQHLWNVVGKHHHHGVNVPVFSLRSEESGGIGEYLDLKELVDWCVNVGFDLIQTLPLNDTGTDSSPYNALSAFALNPIYLSLNKLPNIKECSSLLELKELNKKQRVDYVRVSFLKDNICRSYFKDTYNKWKDKKEYKSFVSDRFWLQGYGLFKALKAVYEQVSWEEWPKAVRDFSEKEYQRLLEDHKETIEYHQYIQFWCHKQLNEAKIYAEKNKVFLKGDIPILLNRDSADVWLYRTLFNLNYSAGAPPDQYSLTGQNWGFPIYDWEEMESQKFSWWKWRLWTASHYYHIYRIDHIVGFFRLWAIPPKCSGKDGFFVPKDSSSWIPQGEKILKMMLETSSMLPIGEDLGSIPLEVREKMMELGICGTKVCRWERSWDKGGAFIPLEDYPKESMTTVSTHDSETLQEWWNKEKKEVMAYCAYKHWVYRTPLPKEYQEKILYNSHHSNSLFHVNLLGEYLSLFPDLSWEDPKDERINVPATIGEHNWSYRMKPFLKDLIGHNEMKIKIKEILLFI